MKSVAHVDNGLKQEIYLKQIATQFGLTERNLFDELQVQKQILKGQSQSQPKSKLEIVPKTEEKPFADSDKTAGLLVLEEKLVELMKKVRFGDPLADESLDMGPMVNLQGQQHAQKMVDEAIKAGGKLLLGGKAVQGKGHYFEPTVIADVSNDMAILREEIFAPVIPVATFDTVDEVIQLANDCEYGLTSSVYTQNINKAMKVISRLKFGETYVNRENFEAMQGFHAGWRKSGIGGADGKHGLEEYLQTHVVYLQYDQEIN